MGRRREGANTSKYRSKLIVNGPKAYKSKKKKDKPALTDLEKAAKIMLISAKARAKERGLPFNLEQQDIIIPSTCPVLGIPLVSSRGKRGPKNNSPSLDRIIPEKGYVRGNVIVVSMLVNRAKSDFSIAQLRLIANFYSSFEK